MEWLIIIVLLVIAYAVVDISTRVRQYLRYTNIFDPDYPYYSAFDLMLAKIEIDDAKKGFEKAKAIHAEYVEKNKEQLDKIRKNADHSEEYKNILRSYHRYSDSIKSHSEKFYHMVEVNYAIRNGKKTFKQVSDEEYDLDRKNGRKKSGYTTWLEYEDQD